LIRQINAVGSSPGRSASAVYGEHSIRVTRTACQTDRSYIRVGPIQGKARCRSGGYGEANRSCIR
jgi:hypothetical protein